ncbi:MAG: hypothetical protein HY846_10850 [Nitrosomonadales bacterium]|nr:hypothetical protein [Nitrosomonadales bacterium]
MNTVKAIATRTAKSLISYSFSILATIASAPSLAQQFEAAPIQTMPSVAMQENMAPVVYKNAALENLTIEQASSMVENANTSRKLRVFRINNMSVANNRSNMLVANDRASFTVNARTPGVNNALTLAGTALQTEMNESLTAWAQMLSLVATRRINAELAYAAKIDKDSRFDSVIAYKLRPNSDSGKPVVVASIKYGIRF